MRFLLVIIAILSLVACSDTSQQPLSIANQKTVTLDVPKMSCGTCPITVRKALSNVPGVIKASASLENKTATVTFDQTQVTVNMLTQATTNAGYPSSLKQ